MFSASPSIVPVASPLVAHTTPNRFARTIAKFLNFFNNNSNKNKCITYIALFTVIDQKRYTELSTRYNIYHRWPRLCVGIYLFNF
jgi:hypothetical protein